MWTSLPTYLYFNSLVVFIDSIRPSRLSEGILGNIGETRRVSYQEIITKLLAKYPQTPRRAWRNGREGIKVFCPCHDDRNPSLHIVDGVDGCWIRCYAGCSRSDVIAAVCGLQFNHTVYARAKTFRGNSTPPWKRPIAKVYNYQDISGRTVFQKVRFDPKDFMMRRPSDNGYHRWSVPMALFTIYNLPQVLTARTVFLLEGEKACDEIAKWGLVGTCSPNGASKTGESLAVKWLPRYTDCFIGKDVILLPDNDEPGENFMVHVYRALNEVRSKTIVRLPRLDAKEDFYDWANLRDGTLAELRYLWKQARNRK